MVMQRAGKSNRPVISARSGAFALVGIAAFFPVLIEGHRVFDSTSLVLSGAGLALLWAVFSARLTLSEAKGASQGILILGNGPLAGKLRRELASASEKQGNKSGKSVEIGVVDPGPPNIGLEDLRQLIMRDGISDLVITDAGLGARPDLTPLFVECKSHGVRVREAKDFYEEINQKVWLEAIRPEWLIYSDVFSPQSSYLVLKRILDLSCSLGVLVLTFPLMALIGFAIKLESSGPILYRQERIGQRGRPFMLYKFRSMCADAEDETGPVWAKENDERVTRVGQFLRRSHLDELPQIVNVVKNELSFVGPRPEREIFASSLAEQIPYFRLREYIKPGITGWAQVSFPYGDSVETAYEKLQYDLYYAKHASIRLDVTVLWRTVKQVVLRRGR